MTVDNKSENSFFESSKDVTVATNFVGFIHRTDGFRWTQAASGAAGRAIVVLCPASSLKQH